MTLEIWRETLRVNLDGTFIAIRAVKDQMLAGGFGRIVCVSSIAAFRPRARQIDWRVLEEHPRGRVVMIDTIAHVHPDDAGQFVVCGSHGGVSSGEYAAAVPVAAVFFNDAGGGKKEAPDAPLWPTSMSAGLRLERLVTTRR